MRLENIVRAISRLTPEECQQLFAYLTRLLEKSPRRPASKVRTRRLKAALDKMVEGLSPSGLDDRTTAMLRRIIANQDSPDDGVECLG